MHIKSFALTKAGKLTVLTTAIVAFSILYLAAISPYWKITPDSSTYVFAAESIAAGRGYTTGGRPVSVLLPGASLVFSVPSFLFPGNYFALNATVAALALASMILAFLFFKEKTNVLDALLLTLMCLGSTALFHHSTFLLSEIVYLFFSLLALVVIQNTATAGSYWPRQLLITLLLIAVCMTRIVGPALVAALLISKITNRIARRPDAACVGIGALTAVIAVVALWEYRNTLLGYSYFELFLQREPWVQDSPHMSVVELATNFLANFDRYRHIAGLFDNGMPQLQRRLSLVFFATTLGVFTLGVLLSLKKELDVAAIYTVVHLWLIGTFQADSGDRYFVPLLPFLFYYAYVGVVFIARSIARLAGPRAAALIAAGIFCYCGGYLAFGFREMMRRIPGEHRSPFGAYPIKYEFNYDVERLALWLRANSELQETYMSQHELLLDPIAQRKGYDFPLTANPQAVLDMVADKRIRYVLVDKKKPEQIKYLLPVILGHPETFNLIREEKQASLYRVNRDGG